ncbi:MAG: hypothetical protein DSY80_08840 [Desulfocapsa sp.]|nr:MAG: hypothetical protein DSY80_08840 [Desulfocapsa sp.]
MNRQDQRIFLELVEKVGDLERRMNNVVRPGRVVDVDVASGKIKVNYAKKEDGSDQVTPFIKWTERAGKAGSGLPGIKTWMPPVVGEQVILFSPSGEIGRHTWAFPGGFSDDAGAPHNAAGEPVIMVGDTRITVKGDKVLCETKHVQFDVEEDVNFNVGDVTVQATKNQVKIDADMIFMNGKMKISLETAQLDIKASSASWNIAGKATEWSDGGMVWRAKSVDWILE